MLWIRFFGLFDPHPTAINKGIYMYFFLGGGRFGFSQERIRISEAGSGSAQVGKHASNVLLLLLFIGSLNVENVLFPSHSLSLKKNKKKTQSSTIPSF